jgi:hypothetical protein
MYVCPVRAVSRVLRCLATLIQQHLCPTDVQQTRITGNLQSTFPFSWNPTHYRLTRETNPSLHIIRLHTVRPLRRHRSNSYKAGNPPPSGKFSHCKFHKKRVFIWFPCSIRLQEENPIFVPKIGGMGLAAAALDACVRDLPSSCNHIVNRIYLNSQARAWRIQRKVFKAQPICNIGA